MAGSSPHPKPENGEWRSLVREIALRCYREDVLGHAAQLAFYFLLALFPMLIFLAALVAYLPVPHFMDNLIGYSSEFLPPVVSSLILQTLKEVTRRRVGLLSFGLVGAMWAASSGIHALTSLLNVAYGIRDMRPWWKERVIAIVLTGALTLSIIAAFSLLFFGGNLGAYLAIKYDLGKGFRTAWNLMQWPLIALFLLFTLDLTYNCAPYRRRTWKWLTPGALFALLAWLIITYGFKLYVSRLANYTLTYGSLGSVIVLLLWLYLTSIAILVGGLINGSLTSEAREATSRT